jgi:hypothetical protein
LEQVRPGVLRESADVTVAEQFFNMPSTPAK